MIHLYETHLPHHNQLYLFFLFFPVSFTTSFPSHSAAILRNRTAPSREYFDELKWKTALPRCQGAVPMVLSELYPSRKLHSHFHLRKNFGWHFALGKFPVCKCYMQNVIQKDRYSAGVIPLFNAALPNIYIERERGTGQLFLFLCNCDSFTCPKIIYFL